MGARRMSSESHNRGVAFMRCYWKSTAPVAVLSQNLSWSKKGITFGDVVKKFLTVLGPEKRQNVTEYCTPKGKKSAQKPSHWQGQSSRPHTPQAFDSHWRDLDQTPRKSPQNDRR
jgi:hypothetical protein